MSAASSPEKPKPRFRDLLPHVWALVRPRRTLLALGFVLMVINRLAGLVLPASTKFVIDDVIGKRHASLLVPIVLAVLGATMLQGASSYALTQILSKAAQRLIADMRRQVQRHIGRLPVAYYDANKTGVLVSRIMSDVEGVRNLIGTGLVEFAGALLTSFFAFVILLRINVMMTVVTLGFLLLLGVGLNKAIGTIRPMFRARPKIQAEVTGRLTESLGGVRVVKGYHAEEREAAVFSSGVQRLLDNVLKTLTATSLMSLSSSVLLGTVSAVIMFIGARQILAATMTLGTLVTYTAFLALLVSPVFQIVGIGTQITEALAGLERTQEVLGERPEDEDPRRARSLPEVRGLVEFDNVSFSYDGGKPVLEGIHLRAEPGTVTALVGPSGAGKSTLIGLIAAFYVPTAGAVRVDGVDLSTVRLDSYRPQLGVVLQETFLFDGTIRENVAFSRPEASAESILAACRIARVDEFAEKFPLGYDTIVGERGVRLSGGQRQRVSIARAILADPRVLLLDEATSSLDSESEALIQEGLSYLMRGRTTFVIAHRLSTIRRADQILVVEAGRIIERGKHAELLAARGRYWELYTRQHGLEENLFLAPGEGTGEPEGTAEEPAAAGAEEREGAGNALAEGVRLLRRREG
jgi:subfamily B ATP-binding cassette protein MsbA